MTPENDRERQFRSIGEILVQEPDPREFVLIADELPGLSADATRISWWLAEQGQLLVRQTISEVLDQWSAILREHHPYLIRLRELEEPLVDRDFAEVQLDAEVVVFQYSLEGLTAGNVNLDFESGLVRPFFEELIDAVRRWPRGYVITTHEAFVTAWQLRKRNRGID